MRRSAASVVDKSQVPKFFTRDIGLKEDDVQAGKCGAPQRVTEFCLLGRVMRTERLIFSRLDDDASAIAHGVEPDLFLKRVPKLSSAEIRVDFAARHGVKYLL